jgi:hypothetical protein
MIQIKSTYLVGQDYNPSYLMYFLKKKHTCNVVRTPAGETWVNENEIFWVFISSLEIPSEPMWTHVVLPARGVQKNQKTD